MGWQLAGIRIESDTQNGGLQLAELLQSGTKRWFHGIPDGSDMGGGLQNIAMNGGSARRLTLFTSTRFACILVGTILPKPRWVVRLIHL